MNIKSNKKSQGPSFLKSAWLGFKEVMNDKTTPLIISFILWGMTYFVWSYSGMLSLFFIVVSLIILLGRDKDWTDKSIMIGLSLFATVALSNTDVYTKEARNIAVEYDKVQFTDSTEKMVIFITAPIKDVLVLHLGDKQYYRAKDISDDFNITIQERTIGDHIGKLVGGNSEISEYAYNLKVTAKDFNYSHGDWKKGTKQLFIGNKNVTK